MGTLPEIRGPTLLRTLLFSVAGSVAAAAFAFGGLNAGAPSPISTPSATVDPELYDIHKPAPTPPLPPPVVRTVVPGLDRGGLFGDGVVISREAVAQVDTSGWRAYESALLGVRFLYPPSWELTEMDNRDAPTGPQGQPSYPIFAAAVRNPKSE